MSRYYKEKSSNPRNSRDHVRTFCHRKTITDPEMNPLKREIESRLDFVQSFDKKEIGKPKRL
ncbi:hypothetical protein A0128_04920 [Leptospira tipperaryensis]|uniref:Uncharacterized protein n=1 Tax=Leptospira tipperaryensis TaxID=2564040 RepID=A0A1D7UUJ7_9LEPT|nr:hypothetical protein A0128_04920 [Leptospira tipperaryensis]